MDNKKKGMNTWIIIGILIPVIAVAFGQYFVIKGTNEENEKFQSEVLKKDDTIISLQHANIDLAEKVNQLTKTIHDINTGEEDYPDMQIKIDGVFLRLKIINSGKYSINDFKIRIPPTVYPFDGLKKDLLWYEISHMNLNYSNPVTEMKFEKWYRGKYILEKDFKVFKPGQIELIQDLHIIGNKIMMGRNKDTHKPEETNPFEDDKFSMNIYFESKLQDWIIFLKFNKVNGQWKYAYRITKVFNGNLIEKKEPFVESDFGYKATELRWMIEE